MSYPPRSPSYGQGGPPPRLPNPTIIPQSRLDYVARRCEERDNEIHWRISGVEKRISERITKLEARMDIWITRGIAATALLMSGLYSLDPSFLGKVLSLVGIGDL